MRAIAALGLSTALLAAGCSRDVGPPMPPGQPEDFVRAADVIVAAQCELDTAVAENLAFRAAEITLTLSVQRIEAAGGGVTLGIPIAGTNLTLSRNRVPRGAALRRMDFTITHRPGETPDCPEKSDRPTPGGLRYIEGGLGLSEWVAEADTLVRKTGHVPSEVNYAMTFEVALNSALQPVFDRPIDGDTTGSLSSVDSDDREVRHRIAVTILPDVPGEPRPTIARLRDAARRFLERITG